MRRIYRYEGGRTVGCLEWDERPGATYELHLDVEPAYQRQGIGRSMVEELESFARAQGGMCLYTFMAADNEKARAFFLAMGFTLIYIPSFYGEGRDARFGCKPIGAPK